MSRQLSISSAIAIAAMGAMVLLTAERGAQESATAGSRAASLIADRAAAAG